MTSRELKGYFATAWLIVRSEEFFRIAPICGPTTLPASSNGANGQRPHAWRQSCCRAPKSPACNSVSRSWSHLLSCACAANDPGADELLDEAFDLALPTGELNRIGRVTAARAEQAWYRGDLDRVARETAIGLEHVRGHTAPWIHGELLFWQSRAQPGSIPDG